MLDPSQLSQAQQDRLKQLANDFPFYARNCIKIIAKDGTQVPFILNSAQRYIHERLEKQKRETGMVRAIIVKGRQQGCSTLIEARFFHRTQFCPNIKAFILTHHSKSTEQLFGMVKQFAQSFPEALQDFSQSATENRNQFTFAASKSSYAVGTAGSDAVGRGFTLQLFHGSEVAFWENTSEIAMGALKAVNPVPGTEIVLESTANGVGNFFHKLAMAGLDPDSTFQTIFVPWYWQPEYRRKVPATFTCDETELKLKELYNLDDEQIFWRRRTIIDEFEGEAWRFQQEYPNTLEEAFVSSEEAYFDAQRIAAARKAKLDLIETAPIVMGVDVAFSRDRAVIVIRQGRHLIAKYEYRGQNSISLAAYIAQHTKEQDVDRIFIDIGAAGPGVFDRVANDHGLAHKITAVNFGGGAQRNDLYQNKRAEMICEAKQWTDSEGGVSIFDDDGFVAEIMAHPRPAPSKVRGTLLFPSKDEIKETLGRSPDAFDAWILTFAYPVPSRSVAKVKQDELKRYGVETTQRVSKTMAHFTSRRR